MSAQDVWAPNTGQVRNAYGAHVGDCHKVSSDGLREFDRWLESDRAEAKAEALEEVAAKMRDKFTAAWIRGQANTIRNGPRPLGGVWGKEGNAV